MGIAEVDLSALEMELQRIYNWIYMEVPLLSMQSHIRTYGRHISPQQILQTLQLGYVITLLRTLLTKDGAKCGKLQTTCAKIGELQICIAPSVVQFLTVGPFGKFAPRNRFLPPTHHHPKST